MDIRKTLSYNDVLLVPRFSGMNTTKSANIELEFKNIPKPFTSCPIINSPMDTVCSPALLKLLHDEFFLPISLHRYFKSAKEQIAFMESCNLSKVSDGRKIFIPVGSIGKWKNWIDELSEYSKTKDYGIMVDMANGDTFSCCDTVKYLRGKNPSINIMAGNVATRSGYNRLAEAGANFIRVGIGGGSACSTRGSIGFGVPTLTSLFDCADAKIDNVYIIADGGIKNDGDIMKAIAAGADLVMMGRQFASTNLSPGIKYDKKFEMTVDEDAYAWCDYRGMSSYEARQDSPCRKTASVEGVSGLVQYFGTTKYFVELVLEHMRTALTYYAGCDNWINFRRKTKFIEISAGAIEESKTHLLHI